MLWPFVSPSPGTPNTEGPSVGGGERCRCLRSFVVFCRGGVRVVVVMVVMTYLIEAPVRAADVSWCLQCSWDYCCLQYNESSQGVTKAAFYYLSSVWDYEVISKHMLGLLQFLQTVTVLTVMAGVAPCCWKKKTFLPDSTMLKGRTSWRHKYFLFVAEWLLQNILLWLEVNLHLLSQLSLG